VHVRPDRTLAAHLNQRHRERYRAMAGPAAAATRRVATLCDVFDVLTRGEHVVIRSGLRGARPRRLALVAIAALIPVLAGCEAGNNAPTLQFHYPTETAGVQVGDLGVRNVFVLGAALGSAIPQGKSASLFLALVNTGPSDRLVSVTAPGTAASVSLPAGGVAVNDGSRVLLSGPKPVLVLDDLTKKLMSGGTIKLILNFAKAGPVTMTVPVFARTSPYATFAPPQPTPSATATTTAKHHKKHSTASPSISPTPSSSG
jgi:copper(I)-binding protein